MSEQVKWINHQADGVSGGTGSSQEFFCEPNNASALTGDHQNARGNEIFNDGSQAAVVLTSLPKTEDTVGAIETTFAVGDGSLPCSFLQSVVFPTSIDASVIDVDEETRMTFEGNIVGESPRVTSPCDPGDVSSPFEAMESDGLDLDDSLFQASGATRRSFPSWQAAQSTTTPGGSSDDDPYSSTNNRKKRRKTKRYMNFYENASKLPLNTSGLTSPLSSQIPSPSPSADAGVNEAEDASATSSFKQQLAYNFSFNNSDSNLHATMVNSRRLSNASESSQNTSISRDVFSVMDSKSEISMGASQDKDKSINSHQHARHRRTNVSTNSGLSLTSQYGASAYGCSLEIQVQPEHQHRARYLTEGSRGPVKDASQQGYPQLQLKGYVGKTTLHVYVGSESEDKIRPHGFYQACKVTGRNTTPCDEVQIDGTKVIQIQFDTQEPISVDCVGILKLRNADVEARIGVSRAKKRNQIVKLVFRVVLEDVPNAPNPLVLQVASNRISCTQPPGQPEITKKSLDRCPADGGVEMFIIGRNFHKGTKVLFQDPEEADGSHWRSYGQVDKDTFNQTHMVVRVPAYHDRSIGKPVSVQVLVEHNDRKCDPHSFTYDPIPKPKPVAGPAGDTQSVNADEESVKPDQDNPLLKTLFGGQIDRKLLEALFSKLLTNSEKDSSDSQPAAAAASSGAAVTTDNTAPTKFPPQPQQTPAPVAFAPSGVQLPGRVEKPVATHGCAGGFVVRPPVFSTYHATAIIKQSGPFNTIASVPRHEPRPPQAAGVNATGNVCTTFVIEGQGSARAQTGGLQGAHNHAGGIGDATRMVVKTESPGWTPQLSGFPSSSALPSRAAEHASGNVVFAASAGANLTPATLPQLTFAHLAPQQAPSAGAASSSAINLQHAQSLAGNNNNPIFHSLATNHHVTAIATNQQFNQISPNQQMNQMHVNQQVTQTTSQQTPTIGDSQQHNQISANQQMNQMHVNQQVTQTTSQQHNQIPANQQMNQMHANQQVNLAASQQAPTIGNIQQHNQISPNQQMNQMHVNQQVNQNTNQQAAAIGSSQQHNQISANQQMNQMHVNQQVTQTTSQQHNQIPANQQMNQMHVNQQVTQTTSHQAAAIVVSQQHNQIPANQQMNHIPANQQVNHIPANQQVNQASSQQHNQISSIQHVDAIAASIAPNPASSSQTLILPTIQTSGWQQVPVAHTHVFASGGTTSAAVTAAAAQNVFSVSAASTSVVNAVHPVHSSGALGHAPGLSSSVKENLAVVLEQQQTPEPWPSQEPQQRLAFATSCASQIASQSASPQAVTSPPNVVSPSGDANAHLPQSFVWPTSLNAVHTYSSPTSAGQTMSQPVLSAPEQQLASHIATPFTFSTAPMQVDHQQQCFSIAETMSFIDNPSTSVPPPQPLQSGHALQSVAPLILNSANHSATSESKDAGAVLSSPLESGETGLSLGFEHGFTLTDAELLSPRKSLGDSRMSHPEILQEIISDCSKGPPQPDADVLRSLLTDCEVRDRPNNVFPPSDSGAVLSAAPMQSSTPPRLASQEQIATGAHFNQSEHYTFAAPSQRSSFSQSADVEMVPANQVQHSPSQSSVQAAHAHEQQTPKRPLPMQGIAYSPTMDASMFVNPNVIQPQIVRSPPDNNSPVSVSQNSSAPNSSTTQFGHEVHQVPQQAKAPTGDLKRLETIDSSALQMTKDDAGSYVQPQQAFASFQSTSVTAAKLEQSPSI